MVIVITVCGRGHIHVKGSVYRRINDHSSSLKTNLTKPISNALQNPYLMIIKICENFLFIR